MNASLNWTATDAHLTQDAPGLAALAERTRKGAFVQRPLSAFTSAGRAGGAGG